MRRLRRLSEAASLCNPVSMQTFVMALNSAMRVSVWAEGVKRCVTAFLARTDPEDSLRTINEERRVKLKGAYNLQWSIAHNFSLGEWVSI